MLNALLLAPFVLAAPTYPEVAPILRRKCCGCHQPGQAGPMALGSYADAAARADSIREAVDDRRMPPWGADPRYGTWRNDRSLSDRERSDLLAWIDAGCPEGMPVKNAAPVATPGWRVKPDVVLQLPQEEHIPATGEIDYRYIKVPTGFDHDVWVRAAEVRPGNRKVVHHALIFATRDGEDISVINGLLASFLPGDDPLELPPGYAKRIPAGVSLVFQMHYTTTGKPETDRSSIGLVLASEPPEHEVRSVNIEQTVFEIPPGAPNYPLRATVKFSGNAELLSLTPHMHLRGKDFEVVLTNPDGKGETLLAVPRYDFNWQISYRFARPFAVPAGSRVGCTAHFDNSAGNPANPDPNQMVVRGHQTGQEMMIGFVDYAVPRDAPSVFEQGSAAPALLLSAPPKPAWLLPGGLVLVGGVFLVLAAVVRRSRLPVKASDREGK